VTARLFLLCILTCFTSCSFNRLFYRYDKIPHEAKHVTLTGRTDIRNADGIIVDSTFNVIFDIGENYTPTFSVANDNVLPRGFSIEGVVFKNRHGKQLSGWFIKPASTTKQDVTILFLHGNVLMR
jgi:dipeptidyl aminopeptidase/acylaminoacyl peptidase